MELLHKLTSHLFCSSAVRFKNNEVLKLLYSISLMFLPNFFYIFFASYVSTFIGFGASMPSFVRTVVCLDDP
jgi:hypothetical protein